MKVLFCTEKQLLDRGWIKTPGGNYTYGQELINNQMVKYFGKWIEIYPRPNSMYQYSADSGDAFCRVWGISDSMLITEEEILKNIIAKLDN